MSELKPCPFCGGEALVQPTYDIDTNECDGFFAWCSNYDCECKPQTRDYLTEAEAIAAWNARAEMSYEDVLILLDELGLSERTCKRFWTGAEMICSSCAHQLNDATANYCPNCGAKVEQ